jgi:hypothetical protein
VFAVCVPGCAGEGERRSAEVSIDTIGGIVHVRNTGAALALRVDSIATIGAPEGPASFGAISAVIADDDGSIYVADSKSAEIRVFDTRGQWVRTIGRRGGGPSEFDLLYSIAWVGDTLAVLDPGNGRVGLMSRTGEWLGQLLHERMTGSRLHLYEVGGALYWVTVARGTGPVQSMFARYAGGTPDTIASPVLPAVTGSSILCRHPTGGGITVFSNPFSIRPRPVPAPGRRVAAVPSGDYRIALITSSGDTARIIEKTHEPVPITDAEWDEATKGYRDWTARAAGAKCNPVEFTRPSAKAAVRDIFHDDRDRMWVESTTRDGFAFDVFDTEGRLVGTVAAPSRFRSVPPYVRDNRLYIVVADSLDVQSVRVLGISR